MTNSPKALPRHSPVIAHPKQLPVPPEQSTWHNSGDGDTSPVRAGAARRNSQNLADPLRTASDDNQANSSDCLFFHELLVTGVNGRTPDDHEQGGSSQGGHLSPPAMAQLVDELGTHLPDQLSEDFNGTVFMPNLGKINIKAQQRQGYWAVELGFDDADALQRVSNSHAACEDALNQALQTPVELILRRL